MATSSKTAESMATKPGKTKAAAKSTKAAGSSKSAGVGELSKPAKADKPGKTKAAGKGAKAAAKSAKPSDTKSSKAAAPGGAKAAKSGEATVSKGKRNKELGARGELAAARFLKRRGYEILERNWTCIAGEADIIARQGCWLCFIEVKTRTGTAKGFPAEAVDSRKRDKYERIAACYLQDCNEDEVRVRFDVISIIVLSETRAFLRFHKNAFGVA